MPLWISYVCDQLYYVWYVFYSTSSGGRRSSTESHSWGCIVQPRKLWGDWKKTKRFNPSLITNDRLIPAPSHTFYVHVYSISSARASFHFTPRSSDGGLWSTVLYLILTTYRGASIKGGTEHVATLLQIVDHCNSTCSGKGGCWRFFFFVNIITLIISYVYIWYRVQWHVQKFLIMNQSIIVQMISASVYVILDLPTCAIRCVSTFIPSQLARLAILVASLSYPCVVMWGPNLLGHAEQLYPQVFDGAKIVIQKGLSRYFQTMHTVTLGSEVQPAQWQFGATYVGSKVVGENEVSVNRCCTVIVSQFIVVAPLRFKF